ncbi:MAG: 16S rRNA (cytidine(1402)-2'-O)-methyltransferase [Gammaproteobacteria bacterium]|jgi:16S rRNA (cytidine1402-2'-O)-methyltransferase|nr:16S rRNA (cytidine(1402)-2'-O)-methyltransferase [Gammaproteobacteria bacterium]
MPQTDSGSLYIVATPVGNLDDITARAIQVLSRVNSIAVEDTRHSRKLLQHFGIDTPMFALHEHNEVQKVDEIIKRISAGEDIALISDAGTPLISDPGYPLVSKASQAGIKVVPIPGASSILAALSCAGLPTDRFVFEGFLPGKKGTRSNQLSKLAAEERTLIFFEAPHRIHACLEDLVTVFGANRYGVIARELTKTYETFLRGTLAELLEMVSADSNQERGEIVLMVAGSDKKDQSLDEASLHIFSTLLEELPLKQASSLAGKITGLGKKAFYQAGLEQKKQQDD